MWLGIDGRENAWEARQCEGGGDVDVDSSVARRSPGCIRKVGETTDRSGPPIGARARARGLDVYEGGEAKGRAPLTGPVYRRRGADGLLGELG